LEQLAKVLLGDILFQPQLAGDGGVDLLIALISRVNISTLALLLFADDLSCYFGNKLFLLRWHLYFALNVN